MFGLNLSRLPKHRKYAYKPVYYDEEKDELHSRVKQIKREMGEEEYTKESVEDSIRAAFKGKTRDIRYTSNKHHKFYGLKILTIAIILGFIFFKLLTSDLLETIFEGLL